jgi:PAS domain S-box-containing protein
MESNLYHKVERVVSRLAAAIGLTVSLALPVAFFADEYNVAGASLKAEAFLQASALTSFVAKNPIMWELPTDRLRAVVEQTRTVGSAARIFASQGREIVRVGSADEWPVLVRQAEFYDFGKPVGVVESAMSVRSILYKTLVVFAVGVTLGLLVYGPLRRIPLQAFQAATLELEASESRYRRLVERAPVGIVKYRHGYIEFVNPAFVTMVGAESADTLAGRDFLELVIPEHRGEAAHMVTALSGGAAFLPFRGYHLLRRDGSVIETEVAAVTSLDGNEWVAQVIIVDLTEQRRAQELVRRSRKRLLEQQHALTGLIRSGVFATGDRDAAVRALTEVAAKEVGVERVSVWRFTEPRDAIQCVDLYERSLDRHASGRILPLRLCPRFVEAIANEEVIVADDARNDELTRELAETYLTPNGIGSMLGVSIRVRGIPDGILFHEHVGPAISWTPEQRMFAIAVGSLAVLALDREARSQAEER